MSPRRTLVGLALLVALVELALVVTTWIPAPSNGGDNAAYVSLAHSLLAGTGYTDVYDPAGLPHTKYPPILPVILAAWIAAGARTWTALKTVPALFTVLWVVMAFLWAARRRTPRFGLAVALLTGASGAVLWSSHWILSEPPFVLFTFLALWAAERGEDDPIGAGRTGRNASKPAGAGAGSGAGAAAAPGDEKPEGAPGSTGWLAVAGVAAVLAYFTRSAGLPLLVAFAGWLTLRRRWRVLAGFAVVAGVPALLWWLRGRRVGETDYAAELWMADPYDPAQGTIGLPGLVARAFDNLEAYVFQHVPVGLVGGSGGAVGGFVALLGLVLALLALLGWGRRTARGPHLAELFFPLYAGLILLWPQVWAGDRFALPLIPLLLFYGGEALLWLTGLASRRALPVVAGVAVAVLALPAAVAWSGAMAGARTCAAAVGAGGAFACYGPPWMEFVDAARWSGENLPEGAAVLTRKPRIFYVMGGVPSRTYPFTDDADAFLQEAREVGARYVILDYLGSQGPTWVGGALRARPEAFCSVRAFGDGAGGARTQLLGIVPEDSGRGGRIRTDDQGRLALAVPTCPPDLMPAAETAVPPAGNEIPLLARGPGR